MLLTRGTEGLPASVTVLGMFDGVHRGHQALLMQGRSLADELGVPLAVHTFEPHPLAVLRPSLQPDRLTTLAERAGLMADMGVDVFCVKRFTMQIAGRQPGDFLCGLRDELHPMAVVAGFNYTFGDHGRGNAELLRTMGLEFGWQTCIVPEVELQGATVSSTRIRMLIEAGRVKEAACLLGRAYSAAGTVMEQDGVRSVPLLPGKVCPKPGDYRGWLQAEERHIPVRIHVTPERTLQLTALDRHLPPAGRRVRILFYE